MFQHSPLPSSSFYEEEEDINHLFPSEEEAIFSLYEQLFCNLQSVCKETILNAMKYLIFTKSMTPQMEEIIHMEPGDVDIVHHRELDNEIEECRKEMKQKLANILQDKFF